MPNAAARRTRKAQNVAPESTPEPQNGVNVVSSLTVDQFQVEELGDYEFTRAGAGRKREPSPFDDLVQEWAGQATRRIPVEDDDQAKEVVKSLQKACEYDAPPKYVPRGLEKRVEEQDGQLYVVFRINETKAKRAPRKSRQETDLPELVDAAETE